KLAEKWQKQQLYKFDANSGKPIFSIDTPPPYTNGVLHMGHIADYTFIDIIARYKRMSGFNVFYPQGWDTMGFPTEISVEKKYGKLPDDEFIEKCKELTTENLAKMRHDMLRLGFSMDTSLEYITMSKEYQAKVQLSLLLMHEKGLVYKGSHAVYWCPHCKSAIAREEIEEIEEKTKLNYIKFAIEGSNEEIQIATTRPEMLHACVALAANPADEKNSKYIGKKAVVPIFGRSVAIIGDEEIDPAFGTGMEMICTFGDKQDLVMYHRHGLEKIDAIDEDGRLKNAGKYTGLSVAEARSAIISDLKEAGLLAKQDEILHSVKTHDRCKHSIELISSKQWFIKTKDFAEKIKETASKIEWIPKFMERYLIDWADYIDWDWVISRNRRFDTPLPFWYCEECDYIVPASADSLPVNPIKAKPPIEKCPRCGGKIVGEKMTCDVWVDSSITPLVIAGWPDNKALFEKVFPEAIRIHATEIIRSWTFYTIFRVWALTGSIPFKQILVHGLILGPDGKKMSKSIGNVVSPDELLEKYSADAIRLWAALGSEISKDRALIFNDVKYAHNFIVKLFNSFTLIEKALQGYDGSFDASQLNDFDKWILNGVNVLIETATKSYESFNFFGVANASIDFYWHDFCDFYLEEVKHIIYGGDSARKKAVQHVLKYVITNTLKILAPIIPFSTDELFSKLERNSIHLQEFPKADASAINPEYAATGAYLNAIIASVRKERTKNKLALNYPITKMIINVPEEYYSLLERNKPELKEVCKVNELVLVKAGELAIKLEFD
ncbi:MAG: valine--tRNA ligase, partial [Candidatus Micrarchaeaceae archaeon]